MATYVDQAYYGWSHEELTHQDDSQEVSAAQMLDHGSISFGRFAYEPLSWEKRSVFTYNKCQEELEKFKSPGLVAKKKAYFEEYYKRIRAMKALQETQQTELTLEYGGDGSVSSQTGEEDETTAQLKNHSEEAPVQESKEKDEECGKAIEIQIRPLDTESLRNNYEKLEEGDKMTIYPHQMQHLDTEITVHESLKEISEEPKQHDLSNLDDNEVSRESSSIVTVSEPEVASRELTSCSNISKSEDLKLKEDLKKVANKVMPAVVRKFKGHVSSIKLKEPSGTTRNGLKSEPKSKSNTVPPMRDPKNPIQKTALKIRNGVGSCKTTPDKVSMNCKPTPRTSDRPLAEVHTKLTVPRPFSFATDRRAAAPSGSSTDGAWRSVSKSSNQQSPAVNGKNVLNIQGKSKRTFEANGVKSKELENRRSHDGRKKLLTLENQSSDFRARGASIPGPVKARSMNLSSHSKANAISRTNIRFKGGVKEDKHKEVRSELRMREFQRADLKAVISTFSASKVKSETKKMTSSWIGNSALSGRRLRFGEQSLDGKKPRQEKPRWR